MKINATVKLNAYAVLEEKFEDAIKYGVMKAWKYSDDPPPRPHPHPTGKTK